MLQDRVRITSDFSSAFLGLSGTLLAVDCCQPKYSQLVLIDGWKYPLWWAEDEIEIIPPKGGKEKGMGNG